MSSKNKHRRRACTIWNFFPNASQLSAHYPSWCLEDAHDDARNIVANPKKRKHEARPRARFPRARACLQETSEALACADHPGSAEDRWMGKYFAFLASIPSGSARRPRPRRPHRRSTRWDSRCAPAAHPGRRAGQSARSSRPRPRSGEGGGFVSQHGYNDADGHHKENQKLDICGCARILAGSSEQTDGYQRPKHVVRAHVALLQRLEPRGPPVRG